VQISSRRYPETQPQDTPSPSPRRRLTAALLSSPAEILELSPFVNSLTPEPGMLSPHFFLASVAPQQYKPCVVVVLEGQRIVGLVYCQERTALGLPTGIVVGDDTLGAMVAAPPEDIQPVLRCAVAALLQHKNAIRWRVSAQHLPLLRSACENAPVDAHFRPGELHAHLPLPETYDQFLAGVGRYTRHNLSRYRRRSLQAGIEFCPDLPWPEFRAAAERLLPLSAHPLSQQDLQRSLAMIGEAPSNLLVGLRGSNGEWISVAGLWFWENRAYLTLQLNHRSYLRESVSLVVRGCLIEHLIQRRIRELIFICGVSPPLCSYVDRREEFTAYIDSRSLPWRLVRRGCVSLAKLAPATFANWQHWQTSKNTAITEA
jgi:hypothetical protein